MDSNLEALELLPREETAHHRGEGTCHIIGPIKTLESGELDGC